MQIGTGPSQTDIATRARRPRRALLILAGAIIAGSAISAAAVRAEAFDDEAGAGPGGPGGMHGHRIEKILDRVNATPAQRAQIRAAWDGLRPQINGLRQQHHAVRKQMLAALTAPTINTADVERLRQQASGLHDKMSSLITQGMVATAQILTPEQRKQAQEEMAKRGGGGHGHRFGPRGQ
jgi:Spy/CpxP family protein refolding chaperone